MNRAYVGFTCLLWLAVLNPGTMLIHNSNRTRSFFRRVRKLTEDTKAMDKVQRTANCKK